MNQTEDAILADLTEPQRQAVTHRDGPLLVLAAAGSGKTRVITRRVACLMAGGVPGRAILAVTFTNKAANEMKQRIDALLDGADDDGWGSRPTVSTFHSFAAMVLRVHHERFGLPNDYTIYDQADRLRAIRAATERIGLDPDNFPPAASESVISREKNRLKTAAKFAAEAAAGAWHDRKIADIFTSYDAVLREANALDFDDLLLRLAVALRDDAEFRGLMHDRYRYVLIDEYQDTNPAQYAIARDLVGPENNLCATGDPDQSIYGWRGADLENILRFERDFKGATVIRLERNYRSTKRILAAADRLIRRNQRRKHKDLWTENPEGEKIVAARLAEPADEAAFVADQVAAAFAAGTPYSQMAVFMRLNALTRELERALADRAVPYQIARGVAFYSRKEIKDALAYLRLLVNPADSVAVERIINTPARGVGKTTLERLVASARERGLSLWQACGGAGEELGRSAPAVAKFVRLIEQLRTETADAPSVARAVEVVLSRSGLTDLYAKDESASANLGELVNAAGQFDQQNDFQVTLADYLQQVALVSDVDAIDPELGAVTLMTLHAAKGLEFDRVFIVGCEQGILPLSREGRIADLEEERRLMFVGITRARRRLVLTHTAERMLHGRTEPAERSQFLAEIGPGELDEQDLVPPDREPSARAGWSRTWQWKSGRGQARPLAAGKTPRDGDDEFADASSFDRPGREMDAADARAIRQASRQAADAASPWPVGTLVRHAKFGIGKVVKVAPSGGYTKATIDFRTGGIKAVMMELAPVERIEG